MKDPAHWQQVEDLFHAALEHPAEERAAFLATACAADATLYAEVAALLTAHEQNDQATLDLHAHLVRQAARQWRTKQAAELNAGQTLSHYRILSLLGRGGMGEVYLAQDSRLGRRVALKLLPPAFLHDAERVRRLAREAQAASTLNHPNIVTIYELGQHQQLDFIVSEYVEGKTLRQQMSEQPLSLEQSLDTAMQMASALDAAHSAGIIHRDIKPENVIRRSDGIVKVLDFGLAKLTQTQKAEHGTRKENASDLPRSSLRDLPSTIPGIVMGTVGYMSPEQARGLTLDARTDIFSLGVVLYEMVARHAPFTGATPNDVIAAILTANPPPLDKIPAALQDILQRALHKEREQRYQSSAELLADLKSLRRNWEATQNTPLTTNERKPAETIALRPIASRRKRGAVMALFFLIVSLLSIWLYLRFKPAAVNAPIAFQTMHLQRITTSGRIASDQAVVSPDGKYLVFVVEEDGQQSLWLKHLVTKATARILPPAEIAYTGLIVSHDSNYLYYITQTPNTSTLLYQVALVGGTPRQLLSEVTSGIALAPDDRQMAFVRNDPATGESALMIANTDGTNVRKLAARTFPDEISWPSWSPQQERVAFVALKNDPQGRFMELRAVLLAEGSEQRLSQHRWGYIGQISWLPDASGVLLTAADLSTNPAQIWQVSLAQDAVRKITNDLNNYSGLSLTAQAEALVSIQTEKTSKLWLIPSTDERLARQIMFGGGKYEGVMGLNWTEDNRILYSSSSISNPELESGDPDLWMMQADGSGQTQLTFQARTNIRPVMTRDGRYIVWASNRVERPNIWRMNADGSNPVRLTTGVDDAAPDCSPDGRWIVYQGIKDTRPVLWKITIDGGEATVLTSEVTSRPVFSPDGRSIACYYYDPHATPQRWRLAILPSEGGTPTKLIDLPATADRLIAPRWTADGQALIYVNTRAGVSNLWRQALDASAPKPLTNFRSNLIFNFAYSRDGKQLVCARGTINHDVVMMTGFR